MVQHRYLGDVDKHEPFGIDDATDGEVFVADGNGGGDWSAVPSPIPHIHWVYVLAEDELDDWLLSTEDAWDNTLITTELRNTISGASLSNSQMTLPAGTYYMRWTANFWLVGSAISTRLYDTTAADAVTYGSTSGLTGTTDVTIETHGEIVFTLTTSSVLEIQYFSSSDANGQSFVGAGGANEETATSVVIWKAA